MDKTKFGLNYFSNGFKLTINAVKMLQKELSEQYGFQYVLLGTTCQDHVESLFGTYRSMDGQVKKLGTHISKHKLSL